MKKEKQSVAKSSVKLKPTAPTFDFDIKGQDHVFETILPYIELYHSGLSFEGRPVGVFLLLGPTGVGKTKTVETVAKNLHGNPKSLLRVDCGEFQMDHEVAKLIGAPPGYLGHRETTPLMTQAKLNFVTSESSNLSVVLFDEIEKGAASLQRLLLGVLDRGILKLGDNTTVNFERSLIFLTSNLGASGLQTFLQGTFGLGGEEKEDKVYGDKCVRAAKKFFSPEFINRIDEFISYDFLSEAAIGEIFDLKIRELNSHISFRKGPDSYTVEFTPASKQQMIDISVSKEYGARHLNRNIQKLIVQKLPKLSPQRGDIVRVDFRKGEFTFVKIASFGI